jgi:hypothetical protein
MESYLVDFLEVTLSLAAELVAKKGVEPLPEGI